MNDFYLDCLKQLRGIIRELEIDISRARVEDLYDFGRLQGRLDGVEESVSILERCFRNDEDNN